MRKIAVKFLFLFFLIIFQVNMVLAAEDVKNFPTKTSIPPSAPEVLLLRTKYLVGAILTTSAFLVTLPISYPLNKDLHFADQLVHQPWSNVAEPTKNSLPSSQSVIEHIDRKISDQYIDYFGRVGIDRPATEFK
jgi:hypothetical protein